ncbi:hypothetical protein Pure05_35640 [Paenarthrobacter ureafaciens]|nr:hypothetical protein Pure01_36570 [Paenarthrobacter ureafaciens]GLU65413.1 hypothetical protein Pure02_36630 [Paenarthrobacter ureafaciens]GLU69800.1 hypothetical protein Pure03_37760 [Paenarthrobacter ureafaciens]GLU73883.1 hypothetical protein Pure04_35980 [Paenarthrobacter ureafaciens]GLU78124.1 hypothetical protein Pure05_35640 [Paenarthrobacter ureafaciens]
MDGEPEPAPGWRNINYTPETRVLTLPAGTVLDFGSSAKAYAAARIAGLLGETLPGGFLIVLGGDIAVAGSVPEGGWQVGIEYERGRVAQVITLSDQALATSSTRHRVWASGSRTAHHIIDPQTGAPAERIWAEVTCLGTTALEANAASTAAVIMGLGAPAWLHAHGIDARLHGSTVMTGNWPSDHPVARYPLMLAVSEVFWFLSRASGITASDLLTVTFILGVMTSGRCRPEGIGSTVVTGLHHNLAFGMMLFLVLHVLTAMADGYVDIGWVAVLLPFSSGYERTWIGLGALALDLLLAVTLTSVLRHRIPEKVVGVTFRSCLHYVRSCLHR